MLRALSVFLLILLAPVAALAASCTASATSVNFGVYTGSSQTPGPIAITVNCTAGSTFVIAVDAGLHSLGGPFRWQLGGSGAVSIGYNLFRDSARTQTVGSTLGVDTITGTGTGSSQIIYLYPTVGSTPAVIPGTYLDLVTITVSVSLGLPVLLPTQILATVPAACNLTAAPLAFGMYSGASIDATSTISVTCTNTTIYTATIDQGLHASGPYQPRMAGPGTDLLNYQLFRDVTRLLAWGSNPALDGIAGIGTGYAQTIPVYGRLPAGQYVAAGLYSDTITVTVNY